MKLFWDLLVRMIVIVTVFDAIGYYLLTRVNALDSIHFVLLIVLELIVITISLWFDIYARKLTA